MARRYRKGRARARGPRVVDKSQVLDGRVSIELPVSVAEIIEGVGQEAEQLAGEAGLLIMKAVMDAEVVSTLASVLNDVEHDGIENFVLQFSGNSNSVAADFPSSPGCGHTDAAAPPCHSTGALALPFFRYWFQMGSFCKYIFSASVVTWHL